MAPARANPIKKLPTCRLLNCLLLRGVLKVLDQLGHVVVAAQAGAALERRGELAQRLEAVSAELRENAGQELLELCGAMTAIQYDATNRFRFAIDTRRMRRDLKSNGKRPEQSKEIGKREKREQMRIVTRANATCVQGSGRGTDT